MKRELLLLLVISLLAILFRAGNFRGVFGGEGGVDLPDTDPYYHSRRIQFCFKNFPILPDFDASMNFPHGARVPYEPGFDLLITTFSKMVSFVHPLDERGVEKVSALSIPFLGLLNVLLLYLVARSLFDRETALLSSLLFAIIPASTVFTKLGKIDHHSVEPLFILLSLFPLLLSDRFGFHGRRRVFAHILSGIFFGLSLYFLRIVALFLLVISLYFMARAFLERRGEGSITLFTAGLTALPFLLKSPFTSDGIFTYFSLSAFHIFLFILLIPLPLVLSLAWRKRGAGPLRLPLFALFLTLYTALLERLSGGEFLGNILKGSGFLSRRNPFVHTVSEQMPLFWGHGEFSLVYPVFFFTPLFFLFPVLLIWLIQRREIIPRSFLLHLLFWTLSTFLLSLLQLRYAGFFAPFYVIILSKGTLSFSKRAREWKKRVLLARVAITVLFISYILSALQLGRYLAAEGRSVVAGRGMSAVMDFLREETPPPGRDIMEPPIRERPLYGVLAPWDMGHWIIYRGKRPNIANPFGIEWFFPGISFTSSFFLERDEERAFQMAREKGVAYVVAKGGLTYIRHCALYMGFEQKEWTPDMVDESGKEGRGEGGKRVRELVLNSKNRGIMESLAFRMGVLGGRELDLGEDLPLPGLKRFKRVFQGGEEGELKVGDEVIRYKEYTVFEIEGWRDGFEKGVKRWGKSPF